MGIRAGTYRKVTSHHHGVRLKRVEMGGISFCCVLAIFASVRNICLFLVVFVEKHLEARGRVVRLSFCPPSFAGWCIAPVLAKLIKKQERAAQRTIQGVL